MRSGHEASHRLPRNSSNPRIANRTAWNTKLARKLTPSSRLSSAGQCTGEAGKEPVSRSDPAVIPLPLPGGGGGTGNTRCDLRDDGSPVDISEGAAKACAGSGGREMGGADPAAGFSRGSGGGGSGFDTWVTLVAGGLSVGVTGLEKRTSNEF